MNAYVKPTAIYWIVAAVALLWNSFGAFDYVMTKTENAAYLAQFTQEQRDYFRHFPTWTTIFWALGVWGAFLGSVALLIRKRWAVTAFSVSLLGLAISTFAQFTGLTGVMPDSIKNGPMILMNFAIWSIALFLLWWSVRARRQGFLRD